MTLICRLQLDDPVGECCVTTVKQSLAAGLSPLPMTTSLLPMIARSSDPETITVHSQQLGSLERLVEHDHPQDPGQSGPQQDCILELSPAFPARSPGRDEVRDV